MAVKLCPVSLLPFTLAQCWHPPLCSCPVSKKRSAFLSCWAYFWGRRATLTTFSMHLAVWGFPAQSSLVFTSCFKFCMRGYFTSNPGLVCYLFVCIRTSSCDLLYCQCNEGQCEYFISIFPRYPRWPVHLWLGPFSPNLLDHTGGGLFLRLDWWTNIAKVWILPTSTLSRTLYLSLSVWNFGYS